MGETMVGCGMPEGCSPWAGGGTMCGEKRLDIRLQRGEREPRQLPTGAKNPVPPQILPRTSGGGYGSTSPNLPGGCFHVRARPCWQCGIPARGDTTLHPRGPSPGISGPRGHRSLGARLCPCGGQRAPTASAAAGPSPTSSSGSGQNPAPAWGHPRGVPCPCREPPGCGDPPGHRDPPGHGGVHGEGWVGVPKATGGDGVHGLSLPANTRA